MATVKKPYYKVRLSGSFTKDITWWKTFSDKFNGKAGMIGGFSPILAVYSDSSNWGFGVTHQNNWLVGSFKELDDRSLAICACHHHISPNKGLGVSHINIKEMWGVFEAAVRLAGGWGDSSVIFITDSVVVKSALNSGPSKLPEIMGLLHKLFWLSVECNFLLISTDINTKIIITCDTLSHLDRHNSISRLMNVDTVGAMHCNHLFQAPFLVSSREGGLTKGAAGV